MGRREHCCSGTAASPISMRTLSCTELAVVLCSDVAMSIAVVKGTCAANPSGGAGAGCSRNLT